MKKLAVLIDADNASAKIAKGLFDEVAKYGLASVKKIYGDWSKPHLKSWQDLLLMYAITPVQQFAYTRGKDATDMQLLIDAMDLLYSDTFDGFCIVSSDSDFTPLVSRIRANGLTVYGVGERKTPEAFRQACDKFIYTDLLQAEDEQANFAVHSDVSHTVDTPIIKQSATNRIERQPIKGQLEQLLRHALNETAEESGWASVSSIGKFLSQTQPDFDSRNYGYAKLSAMLKELEGVQLKIHGSNMYCRKIPYGEFIKLLNSAFEKFQDKQGTASEVALEKYITARFNFKDYGFEAFSDFLDTVHNVERQNNRVRLNK